jgi:hypothetical protein
MIRSRRIKLTVEEWNFDPCPEKELRFCWAYEYTREVSTTESVVAKWRSKTAAQTFEALCALAKNEGAPSVCVPTDLFQYFPEWPARPYLSIEPLERNRRYKKLYPKSDAEYASSSLVPRLPQDERMWDMLMTELYSSARDGGIPKASIPGEKSAEFILLRIDWHLTNKALMQRFQGFLESRPPAAIQYRKKEGKGSHPEIMKADLKALGALRLRRAMRVSDIPSYTAEVLEKPLYSQETSILRAVKRAQKIIRSFEH